MATPRAWFLVGPMVVVCDRHASTPEEAERAYGDPHADFIEAVELSGARADLHVELVCWICGGVVHRPRRYLDIDRADLEARAALASLRRCADVLPRVAVTREEDSDRRMSDDMATAATFILRAIECVERWYPDRF
jgi:hypothetical protein